MDNEKNFHHEHVQETVPESTSKGRKVRRCSRNSYIVKCPIGEEERAQIMDNIASLGYTCENELARRTIVSRFREESCKCDDNDFRNTVLGKNSTSNAFVERMDGHERELFFIVKSSEYNYMVDVFDGRENVVLQNFEQRTAYDIFTLNLK